MVVAAYKEMKRCQTTEALHESELDQVSSVVNAILMEYHDNCPARGTLMSHICHSLDAIATKAVYLTMRAARKMTSNSVVPSVL
jgi:hypothetical protein